MLEISQEGLGSLCTIDYTLLVHIGASCETISSGTYTIGKRLFQWTEQAKLVGYGAGNKEYVSKRVRK